MIDYNERIPENIARRADHIENNRANRAAINKEFHRFDESHLFPINNRFDATERAIRQAQKFMRESGHDIAGLEYALLLDQLLSTIVNKEV